MAKTKIKKSRVEKPYNNGTLSEAGYWQFIRSALRKASRWWKPAQQCKLEARRPYTGEGKRTKWEYRCNHCENWFPEKEIQIDHIIEAGSLKSGDDLKGFVERLFPEKDGYQCLCLTCHHTKTQSFKQELKNERKNQ